MRFVAQIPKAPLDRFVSSLWYHEALELPDELERILPQGRMSLLVHLEDEPLRWYPGEDRKHRRDVGLAAICGMYPRYFTIDTAQQRRIVGVSFHPGGSVPFFRPPADAIGADHLALDDLWGREAGLFRERLLEAAGPRDKLRALEAMLVERLVTVEREPAVDVALRAFADPSQSVGELTASLGIGDKRFVRLFRRHVGLTPKRYCRLRRFQLALEAIARGGRIGWTDLALSCGYYDQAHFIHDFRAFSGVTPSRYVAQARAVNHVRLAEGSAAGEGLELGA